MSRPRIEFMELIRLVLKILLLYLTRDDIRRQIDRYLVDSKTLVEDLVGATLVSILWKQNRTAREILDILQIPEEASENYLERYRLLATAIEEILANINIEIDRILDEAISLSDKVRILEYEVSKLRTELDRCINEKKLREKLSELEKIILQLESKT